MISRNFLEISKKSPDISRKFLAISKNFLEFSRNFQYFSRNFTEISRNFLEISMKFLGLESFVGDLVSHPGNAPNGASVSTHAPSSSGSHLCASPALGPPRWLITLKI